MRKLLVLSAIATCISYTFAQEPIPVTLESCYAMAMQYYPTSGQTEVLDNIYAESLQRINGLWQPQIMLNTQATYQSDVTHVPISFPGIDIPGLSKDQYKATIDLSQVLYDGGVTKQQKSIQEANTTVEKNKVQVDLYALKEKINTLFFAILLADAQREQIDNTKLALYYKEEKIKSGITYGVATQMDLDIFRSERLKLDRQETELMSMRNTAVKTLSLLTGSSMGNDSYFITPEAPAQVNTKMNRPELALFEAQEMLLQRKADFSAAMDLPKISVFAQGGYGKPGLNFLDDEFAFFYIAGIKLQYPIWTGNVKKHDATMYTYNKSIVDMQRNAFLLQTQVDYTRAQESADKYHEMLSMDIEQVDLKTSILQAADAQLENGTITAKDYVSYVYDKSNAELQLAMDKLQELSEQIHAITINGNDYAN